MRPEQSVETPWTPDENALGAALPLNPVRYDGHSDDPREVAGLMRAEMPSGVRVLDVGCGTGALTMVVNEGKLNRVFGIEPDADRAALAGSRGIEILGTEVHDGFVRDHGQFDVIILADVIEHVPSPDLFVDRTVSALKPGGLLLVSVPNVAHWSVRLNLLAGRFDYEDVGIMDRTHLRWFTAKTISALLRSHGLVIETVRQSAGAALPVYQRSLFRLVPGRLVRPAVRAAARLMPRLFGCQHVISARKPA